MGNFQVVFSLHAERDLEKIVRHVSRDDVEAAIRLGNKLIERALQLSHPENVYRGTNVSKRPGIRKLIEGNYLIFYRPYREERKIRVLRFWHAARDRKGLRLAV